VPKPCPCLPDRPCLKAWACWFWLRELPLNGTEERQQARRAVALKYTRHLQEGRPELAQATLLWPLWPPHEECSQR
jgi:hypothetical protein